MCWFLLVILSTVVSIVRNENVKRLVMTSQGPVIGRTESDEVFAFYNIPYATAPTGNDKFKAPLPPPNWKDPIQAIDKGVICPQADLDDRKILKSKLVQEDCLIANVYVPDTLENSLSVVLYIHGGAFQVGFGDRRKAKQLMNTKPLIVVTFNYRLGVTGFLCLGTKDIPGNAGMKDMVAMLQWLKKNIASFGGNPDDITISGYSTGAVAADLLILSKSARGLFHKVIVESGSNLAPFAVQSDPIDIAKDYAKRLNFADGHDLYGLELFYKNIPYHVLYSDTFLSRKDSSFVFVPCVEDKSEKDIFLHDSPINILKSGNYTKVPMLYGFTSMEGVMRLPLFNTWKSGMNDNFSSYLPADLVFYNDDQRDEVANLVKEFYFGYKSVDSSTIEGYVNFFTDTMFVSPALRSVSLNVASGNNEIYLYYYSFVDESGLNVQNRKLRGAYHCAQSISIFDDLQPKNISDEYQNIRQIMRAMWANFIRIGNPVIEDLAFPMSWPPTNVDRDPYMSIGQKVEVSGQLLEERVRFWDEIYQKYAREPVSPPRRSRIKSSDYYKSLYKQKGTFDAQKYYTFVQL